MKKKAILLAITLACLCLLAQVCLAQPMTLPAHLTRIEQEAFKNCADLTGVVEIPDGVTEIGAEAFYGCTGLTGTPVIPRDIEAIGARAFYGCTGLSGTIVLPTSVRIAEDAFAGCEGLTVKQIDETPAEYFEYSVDRDSEGREFVTITGWCGPENYENLVIPFTIEGKPVRVIGSHAFEGRNGLNGNLTILDNVTTIGGRAFQDCSGFTGKLTISDSVVTIGDSAFCYCRGFTGNLTIPDSVTTIGNAAFAHCSGFTGDLTIPNSVTTIGGTAFSSCSGFSGNLTISDSITVIYVGTFLGCSGLTGDLMIPDKVTSIYAQAFYGCGGFSGNLTIPDSVTTIGQEAFTHCNGFIGNLTIPDSVATIYSYAFQDCSGFTGLTISDSVTRIYEGVFKDCSGFTGSLTIPDSVKIIGERAFEGCSGFTGSLAIPDGITYIGEWAFTGCSGFTGNLAIPEGVTYIGGGAFSCCSGFTGKLTIPGSVTWIGPSAFEGCSNFTGHLTIPGSVTWLLSSAFSGCSGFIGLTIPDSVTEIEYGVFAGCSALTNIILPEGMTSIDKCAFQDCTSLTSVSFPASITEIGRNAFLNCSKLSGNFVFADGASIASDAFANCPNVKTYFKGEYDDIRILAENTLLNFMNDAILPPEDLIGVMKSEQDGTWFHYLINAAVNVTHLDFDQLITTLDKEEYLFANALSFSDSGTAVNLTKFDSLPQEVKNLNGVIVDSKDAFFNSLDALRKKKFGDQVTTDSFKDLFEQYRKHDITKKDYETGLTFCGIKDNQISDIVDMSDWLGELSRINDVVETISEGEKKVNGLIDLWNQLQMVNALDKTAMREAARIYKQSDDPDIVLVGKKLEDMANANEAGRITMLAMGDFIHAKIDKMVDKALEEAATNVLGNGVTLTVKITNAVIDTFTGVDQIPRLTNEIHYAADAVESTYNVFQKDLEAYNASATPANFENAYWDYITYLEVAAQSQDAFVALYKQVDDAIVGDVFMTDEARQLLAWAEEQSAGLNRFADDARAIYALRATGDVEAFRDRIEEIRKQEYTQPFSGGGGEGGGGGSGGGR